MLSRLLQASRRSAVGRFRPQSPDMMAFGVLRKMSTRVSPTMRLKLDAMVARHAVLCEELTNDLKEHV